MSTFLIIFLMSCLMSQSRFDVERVGSLSFSQTFLSETRTEGWGNGIVGQRIDVFTGTGKTAEEETFRITSNNNRVFFTKD